MTHSTETERTIVPRGQARVLTNAARLIGIPCDFALRNVRAARAAGQMWRRAIVSGGDS